MSDAWIERWRYISSCLIYYLTHEVMGRRTLVEQTGFTESRVRTALERLRQDGFVSMDKQGTQVTEAGRQAFKQVLDMVKGLETLQLKELSLGRFNRATLLNELGADFSRSWRYRDVAIREGASAVLFLTCNDELRFSDETQPLAAQNPDDAKTIRQTFQAWTPGDLVVIVFAEARGAAEAGLWRVIDQLSQPQMRAI
ncbi:MAG: DUF4443 domain-containing protein [Candidatus Bipolaricaulia bacterium]